ncbi:MAG: hypothetical protein ACK5JR_10540 [Tropicimonas sp.]|uniref:hypothetical protein n=1 Tax=Tropicimonas sp. TaxID=2067044 RepID=UPI003A898A09
MFKDLITILEENGKGIHALRKGAQAARARAAAEPDRAAAWTLMALRAEEFIDANERMAITAGQTKTLFEQIATETARLDTAFAGADAGEKLAVLNDIAASLARGAG